MRVRSLITRSDFLITADQVYDVFKVINSPEIGDLYQIKNDSGKLTNLQAIHFTLLDEKSSEAQAVIIDKRKDELVALHRRQYLHNREAFVNACQEITNMTIPPEECSGANISDVEDFTEKAKEYLLAMLFHSGSLRCVGFKVIDDQA